MNPHNIKRAKARHLALCDQFDAGKHKPPTRKDARAWLAPIRRAFNQIKQGEVDAHRGYPITRIHHADNDFARIDHCINGFVAMIERLDTGLDISPLRKVSTKLENGVLLTVQEIDACFALLNASETALLRFSRGHLADVAKIEQINIEFERMGLKEAA